MLIAKWNFIIGNLNAGSVAVTQHACTVIYSFAL